MSRVGQISIARPGLPLQLEFEESKLKTVIEDNAQAGDHVTLYPGDYTTWYEGLENAQEETKISIPNKVSVTVLPGARVEYSESFREEDFSHDDKTFNAPDHPLKRDAQGFVPRYEVPRFKGHIENIVDMNLASEWAFETDLEKLRTAFENRGDRGTTFGVSAESQTSTPDLELGETLEFRGNDNVNITTERLSEPQEGIGVNVEFDKNFVTNVEGGRLIKTNSATGEVKIEHEEVLPSGSLENSGNRVIQSLFFTGGHVKRGETKEIATVNQRAPNRNEGEEGDIWFVEDKPFNIDVFFSSNRPDQIDGSEGDLWVLGENQSASSEEAGEFYISEGTPSVSDAKLTSFWLDFQDGQYEPTQDPINLQDVAKVTYRENSPRPKNGENNQIWATITREV